MTTTFRRLGALAATAALALGLASCQSAPAAPAAQPTEQAAAEPEAQFPRTITVPGAPGGEATELTIEARPERVATLSYESTEVTAALGAADRLVLIPEATRNPALGGHTEELAEVPASFESESSLNTEAVIAATPDLVLMNSRHGLDESVGAALERAGIPVLVLPNSWSTVDELRTDVGLIGQALGEDDAAAELDGALEDGLAPVAGAGAADAPSVLVLSNQAGRPFVTAGTAFPLEILRLAGGQDASAALGLDRTGPISAEQVIEANPDAILLVDMNGSGERLFASIMDNPAVAALPGAAEPLLVTGAQVQALGLTHTIAGLGAISDWLAAR
ncbi:ABC transporter substrate-binding protein [Leucobacter sp. M11]|uniref:ABC transporter substrate-binding protein n=1 Tax=Leucobacter sp. M11 TaxID=2993565 RepID=UPI002D80B404|nr:ABC transporter substrate-binding protein [Leucobacter sp. M11]MEB4615071.1 ABC transporter substrate-binding protein [Leucobacter sp. M11]